MLLVGHVRQQRARIFLSTSLLSLSTVIALILALNVNCPEPVVALYPHIFPIAQLKIPFTLCTLCVLIPEPSSFPSHNYFTFPHGSRKALTSAYCTKPEVLR